MGRQQGSRRLLGTVRCRQDRGGLAMLVTTDDHRRSLAVQEQLDFAVEIGVQVLDSFRIRGYTAGKR